jgi:hypothetical protein
MSRPSRMISPRLIPMRNSIRRASGTGALRSAIPCCTSTAQRTASTTLANSISSPSPVVLTMRPLCSLTLGSPSSRRIAFNSASVPSSSVPMRREYPATSAARFAARRRVEAMARAGPLIEDQGFNYSTTRASRYAPDETASVPDGPKRPSQPRQFAVTIAVRSWWLCGLRKGRTR